MASSYYGSRSTTSIASKTSRITLSHSIPGSKQLKLHWWQKRPVISSALFTDLQKGSYFAAIFTLVQSLIQLLLASFDAYCLYEARPGSRHFRSFGISFLFVYAGNEYVRKSLIICSVLLFGLACWLMFSSVVLMSALKKEHEARFRHWLYAMGTYLIVRFLTLLFQSLVNDLYFTYHRMTLGGFLLLLAADFFFFLVVVSNYQELSDITRLEDMAKLKMSTLSSLHASRSLSHHSLDSYRGMNTIQAHPSPMTSIHTRSQLNPLGQQTPQQQRGSTSLSLNELLYSRGNTSY